jgi:Pyruvate/2-oxoacid:ferredoxin oxidoreductase delta subunit
MARYFINESCINCYSCVNVCAVEAVSPRGDKQVINQETCDGCGVCRDVCPAEAIVMR